MSDTENTPTAENEDVEGHRFSSATEDDDVQGHKRAPMATEDDDVIGHKRAPM
jgi:hypothetical protein